MLSKEDYKNYLEQVENIENSMAGVYRECVSRLEDKNIKSICQKLMEDEERHAALVRQIMKLMGTGDLQ